VAYAGDAFTVAPLTDDARNVALFLDALAPEVMPVDGQRGDRAIAWSSQLLRQAGFASGQILLMTDHADDAARVAAGEAH
jgi:Ca-activated chloride channel family protein